MDNKTRAAVIACVVVAFAVGYGSAASPYSPIKPKPDRPFLKKLLGTAARAGLWFLVLAEPPAADGQESHLVHHHLVGDDGYQRLNHAESF